MTEKNLPPGPPQAESAGELQPPDPASENPASDPGERLCSELKERVERGEYWVDLDFLACLLVDSQVHRLSFDDPS